MNGRVEESHSLLVIEDEAHTREILHYVLTRAGYNVWLAADGHEGLRSLTEKPCDLIVCDVMMPGIDGFTLRDLVRKDPRTRELPFIFLTARNQATDQIRGLELCVEDYITKPFDLAVLKARIDAVLRRRRTYAESLRIDPLTHLLNRQALEQEVKKALQRVQRYAEFGTLLFLDLDDFKHINDTYGHEMGDRALVRFAELIRAHSRANDIAGRYGGEEFVLYLPHTRLDGARMAVERIQEGFKRSSLQVSGQSGTFSAGAAIAPDHGTQFQELCARADRAMYQAKKHGKARMEVWSEKLEESRI